MGIEVLLSQNEQHCQRDGIAGVVVCRLRKRRHLLSHSQGTRLSHFIFLSLAGTTIVHHGINEDCIFWTHNQ